MRKLKRPEGCCPPKGLPAPVKRAGDDRLLSSLRAAADPTRLQVLRLLAAAKAPVCVCDITSRFRLSQPTISHHLGLLRRAGLVSTTRRGIWAYYTLHPAGLARLRGGVLDLAPEEGCCGE